MASKLTRTDAVNAGDLVVLYKNNQGDYRGIPESDFIDYIKTQLGQVTFATQNVVVAATGQNVNVTDNGSNIWTIIRPAAAYAAMTITLPALATSVDGQEIMVFCTRQITTLTVNGNGAVDVLGEPSSLAADDHFKLRFDSASSSWYRVG